MKIEGKGNQRNVKTAAFIIIFIAAALIMQGTAYAYHQATVEDFKDIVRQGKDFAGFIAESISISDISIYDVGFQKFIFVLVCTIGGIIAGWEWGKKEAAKPQGQAPAPAAGGGRP